MAFNLLRLAPILLAALIMIAECYSSYTLAFKMVHIKGADGRVQEYDIFAFYNQTLSTEKLKDCVKAANEEIEHSPNDGMSYAFRGIASWHLESFKSAIEDLTKASALLKNRTPYLVYRARGECYANLGDAQKAIDDFSAGFKVDPGTDCLYRRQEIYSQLRQYDNALADANTMIEREPKRSWPFKIRSVIYFHLGRYEDEVTDLTKAIELEKDKPLYYADRAVAYDKLGKHLLAEKDRKTCNEFSLDAKMFK